VGARRGLGFHAAQEGVGRAEGGGDSGGGASAGIPPGGGAFASLALDGFRMWTVRQAGFESGGGPAASGSGAAGAGSAGGFQSGWYSPPAPCLDLTLISSAISN